MDDHNPVQDGFGAEIFHSYVSFALDGQMHLTYPDTFGLSWKIVIDEQAGPPDARTSVVIARLAEAVRRYGGDLGLM